MINDFTNFKPERALRKKYMLILMSFTISIWLFSGLPIWFASVKIFAFISFGFVVMLIFGWFVIIRYYETINFEILNDEVHVNRGLITKSRKIVPYRTITNIEIKRGPYDRLLGIGSVEIQTAGSSAPNKPEEKLDGVDRDQLEAIQKVLIDNVRKIRGSPGTSHDVESVNSIKVKESEISGKILLEIKELKAILKEIRDK